MFQVELPLTAVYDHSTIAEFARCIEQAGDPKDKKKAKEKKKNKKNKKEKKKDKKKNKKKNKKEKKPRARSGSGT